MMPYFRPAIAKRQHNALKSEDKVRKAAKSSYEKVRAVKQKLKEMGIKFNTKLVVSF